jgi:acetyltransferase-like isoleucine patch superfamily enzyme
MKRRGFVGKDVKMGLGSIIIARRIEIGDHSGIGVGTHIVADSVKIGKRAWIGHRNQIRTNALEMADDSEITHDVTIGGMDSPQSRLVLGKRSSIMAHSFINTTHPVTIGNDVGVGGYCKLFTHGSWQSVLEGYPIQFGPVTIEDGVWIPWDVFIMPNVTIGMGSTIGARSLITKSIPSSSLAVGSPAKVIRQAPDYPPKRTPEEMIQSMEEIMHEMKQYFDWKGWPLEIKRHEKSSWILTQGEGRVSKNDAIVLSLQTIGAKPQNFIDLERKVDSLDLNSIWKREVRNFLGRYGIRTDHIEPSNLPS